VDIKPRFHHDKKWLVKDQLEAMLGSWKAELILKHSDEDRLVLYESE
jgi:hypothetical protein